MVIGSIRVGKSCAEHTMLEQTMADRSSRFIVHNLDNWWIRVFAAKVPAVFYYEIKALLRLRWTV
jgi:hypothetical protein